MARRMRSPDAHTFFYEKSGMDVGKERGRERAGITVRVFATHF